MGWNWTMVQLLAVPGGLRNVAAVSDTALASPVTCQCQLVQRWTGILRDDKAVSIPERIHCISWVVTAVGHAWACTRSHSFIGL